jgi:hypothetical protein
MNDIKVSFFKSLYTAKPSNAEAAMLSTIIADKIISVNCDNIKIFAELVGEKGCTFCPATFKNGTRSKENFDQLQLLALDFDNKEPDKQISFETIKDRAEHYDLPILFAYDTFTGRNHNKFRVVFLNDVSVPDVRVAEMMLKALTTIFYEADPQSKSAVQMYYGGKDLLYFDESIPEINMESLLRNTTIYLEDRYGAKHYKQKLADFAWNTGVALNEKKLLDVSVVNNPAEVTRDGGNNLPNPSIYIPFGKKFLMKYFKINFGECCTSSLGDKKKSNYHRSLRSSDLRNIGSSCRLFREFETGERRLHHDELFGIATNLIQVESGIPRFKDILREHFYYDPQSQRYRKWEQDLRYIKEYKPYSCDGFCPYHDQCPHGTNLLSTVKVRYHQFEKIANNDEPLFPIEEAMENFKRNLVKAMEVNDSKWHIIKAQTALGKSQAYLELLRDTQRRVLIAVPTNKLKHEIHERAVVSRWFFKFIYAEL